MCMSAPDMPEIDIPDPPKPPPAPAPPAPGPQGGASEKQGAPEDPNKGDGKRKRKDRSSLRIPKNRSKGVNLPGSGGSSGGDS